MAQGSSNISRTAIILATHGSSRDDRINRPMFGLADKISDLSSFASVTPAFLDGEPDVRTVIHQVSEDEVIVVPFMTSSGYYTDTVFPDALAGPDKTVKFTKPIGVNTRMTELVYQQIYKIKTESEGDRDATVVVAGHGTRRNKTSCRSTINLVMQLREKLPGQTIEFGFIDQNPALALVAGRVTTPVCIVIPFLMGLGPHMTQDVPEAFGISEISDRVFDPDLEFPIVESRIDNNGNRQEVYFDMPVGQYPEWADLCIELSTELSQRPADQESVS